MGLVASRVGGIALSIASLAFFIEVAERVFGDGNSNPHVVTLGTLALVALAVEVVVVVVSVALGQDIGRVWPNMFRIGVILSLTFWLFDSRVRSTREFADVMTRWCLILIAVSSVGGILAWMKDERMGNRMARKQKERDFAAFHESIRGPGEGVPGGHAKYAASQAAKMDSITKSIAARIEYSEPQEWDDSARRNVRIALARSQLNADELLALYQEGIMPWDKERRGPNEAQRFESNLNSLLSELLWLRSQLARESGTITHEER